MAVLGVALAAGSIAANQAWLDRHFLPSFFVTRAWYVRAETTVRVAIALVGLASIGAAGLIGRFFARSPGRAVPIAVAVAAALGASELVLRWAPPRPLGWLVADDEPRRQPDARLGWVLTPSRVGRVVIEGRTIEYAVDANGYRVRTLDEPVDFTRPTILFAGESVMFGDGLAWDDSVPARVGALMRLQSANLAVHGYSSDQAYLRLEKELPRFQQPVAVVALFMTTLFGRNLDDDRPHLGPGLAWLPANPPSRLGALTALLVPFRRDQTVDDGVRMTRDALRATAALAKARGAGLLMLVPQIGPESPPEANLRHRILDASGVPYAFVEIDPEWHLPLDRHPDARGAQVMAAAIAARLGRT
ncbi:MAG TPA: hypothetical protein VKE51_36850 [Vicinamibacterales bacterium]|nr:hypothetical protein [Vicinamibacterales bacterium]